MNLWSKPGLHRNTERCSLISIPTFGARTGSTRSSDFGFTAPTPQISKHTEPSCIEGSYPSLHMIAKYKSLS